MTEEPINEVEEGKKNPSFLLPVILVVLILIVGAALYAMFMQKPLATAGSDDRWSVFEARLENLEKGILLSEGRVTRLEEGQKTLDTRVNQLASAQADVASVTNTNTETNTESSPVATAVALTEEASKRLESLEKELAAIKAAAPMQDSEHMAHSIKLLSAFHRLSNNVLAGKPYSEELSSFEELIGDSTSQNKPLMQLATYADNGVPTLAELLTSFDNAVEQLRNAQAVPPAEAGAWERFTFNLKHLVRVRRIDEGQKGSDVDAVTGRAAAALEKGQLEAAVSEINSLSEKDKGDFTAWMEDAQVAIDAQGIIDELEEQVMQQVFVTTKNPDVNTESTGQDSTIQ